MPNAASEGIALLQHFSRLVTDQEKVAHIHCTSFHESHEKSTDRSTSRTDRVHLVSGHTGQTSPGADLNLHCDTPTRVNLAFFGPSESSTGHFSKKQKDDSLRRRKRRAFSRGKSKEAFGLITHSRAVATDASWQGRRMQRGRQPAAGRSWSQGWGGIR